ncbi:D-alanyl-D-alanine carboxypeptidase family protein [Brucellaceae bacterium C25G]
MLLKLIKCCLTATALSCAGLSNAAATPSIVVDVATGKVYSHEDAFQRWYPASLTKMMSAYVAFRMLETGQVSPETLVRVSANAVKEPPSKMGYKAGSTMTLDTALKIMMVKSANDISVAVAETLGGSVDGFARMMNAEAAQLGMTGSHFVNPHGLPDPQNYTTARDLAILGMALRRQFPQYAHYFNVEALDFTDGHRQELNGNILLGRYNGADGMKTGFICASGFNLVASATRQGKTVMSVVLGADRQETRAAKSAELMETAFNGNPATAPDLKNIAPYGQNNNVAPDLRAQICNQEAIASRWEGREVEGFMKINSPYVHDMKHEPRAITVGLVSNAPEKKPGQLHISQVPIPLQRPFKSGS